MTPPDRAALLQAAQSAAAQGWPVIPLRPGTKRAAGHRQDRCPGTGRCANGHLTPEQRATTDLGLIEQCWTSAPYGIGIATGPAHLVVIDLDVPKQENSTKDAPDGATTFKALCERHDQPWPETYTVRTPSGGQHLYHTAPHGNRLRGTVRQLGPGIDTRAWGGYVVAPGTITSAGRYETTSPRPVAPLPTWLHHLLTPPPRPVPAPVPVVCSGRAERYVRAALEAETRAVANAPEGTRNWHLTRAARALGRFVATGQLDRTVVEEALKGGADHCGLPPADAHATLTNALNWSITHNARDSAA